MKKIVTSTSLLFCLATAFAQVGIGTNTPNPSSLLHLESSTRGLLPPRMDSTARKPLVTPQRAYRYLIPAPTRILTTTASYGKAIYRVLTKCL